LVILLGQSKIMNKDFKKYLIIKRFLDIIFAFLLLFATFPLLLFSAILIKSSSKGPVLFKQKRPGKHKKIFTIYKFRTMKTELIKKDIFLLDNERITSVGKFLRAASIDELPQLINVIKGDMSFIGPRPFLINDLGSYTIEQEVRFNVLPGITSWTAIHGRNNQTIQQKYNLEIFYVKNISFKLDLIIFIKTIFLVFSFKNIDDTLNKPRIGAEIIDKEV
jgi:lipopolysaccharide/colanic/teichoic acid biosynthesis glycosyltransferase